MSNQNGYLSVPGQGKGRGVLLIHAWWGLTGFIKSLSDRLASEGFVTFAPDLYNGKTASTIPEAVHLRSQLKRADAQANLKKAAKYLRGLEAVTKPELGLIGFSLGAYFGIELAEELPDYFKAVVIFYGTRGLKQVNSKAAYLGHFAENDDYESPESRRKLEKILKSSGTDPQFYVYPGTLHWFFESDRPEYRPEMAEQAWERTVTFLHDQLV